MTPEIDHASAEAKARQFISFEPLWFSIAKHGDKEHQDRAAGYLNAADVSRAYLEQTEKLKQYERCDGSGTRDCTNPDCDFIAAVSSERLYGHRNGCPECGHSGKSKCEGCARCWPRRVETLAAENARLREALAIMSHAYRTDNAPPTLIIEFAESVERDARGGA